AEIVDLPGFSVHADSAELLDWVAAAPEPPETVYVVHGEPQASAALASEIRRELDWSATVPALGELIAL
ncbi:MAG: MBL fold metallo-hydrolase RNA specificity domain-containing protein, partial [Ilumatobacteraceae bacterium]